MGVPRRYSMTSLFTEPGDEMWITCLSILSMEKGVRLNTNNTNKVVPVSNRQGGKILYRQSTIPVFHEKSE